MTLPATASQALALQYQTEAGEWVTAARCDVGTILRTRRLASPPGRPMTARRFRIVKLGDADLTGGVLRLTKLAAWRETAALSDVRRWAFDFDAGASRYGLVATDGNLEVHRRGERVASIASPYMQGAITDVRRAQSLDTMIAFHPDVPPMRITRQGADSEWDVRAQAFENIPKFDYDGTRAGGIDEVQQLAFSDFNNGDTFNLTLEDYTSTSIAYSSNMATLANNVRNALVALANIGAGGVTVTSPADATLRVTFIAKNRADDVGELVAQVLTSEKGICRVATVTQGEPGGEPVISATRGWPAAGVFYEQRLWLAAPRSRPQTLLASRVGFYFDLNTRGGQADKGVDVELATDQSTKVLALYGGRHLQAFSQSAEFFCPAQPITPPPPFPRTSSVGIEPGTPLFEMDGGTLFIQAGGATVSQYIYSEEGGGYAVQPLSTYAPHITRGIVAGGFRRHRSTSEPNLALWIRATGEATVMWALLGQDVLGFAPWTTDGKFVDAGGELAGDLYVITLREAADGLSHRLERVDEGRFLDASVRVDAAPDEPVSTIEGLGHLEGRLVAVMIDGEDAGDALVVDGAVALPRVALSWAEAGLLFQPRGRILPLVMQNDPRAGGSMHARSGEIAFRLGPTANLKAGMAGKRMWSVSLKHSALPGIGSGEDGYEGWARLFPVPGFQDDAQIEWVQERPGPLEIREVVVTVSS